MTQIDSYLLLPQLPASRASTRHAKYVPFRRKSIHDNPGQENPSKKKNEISE